MLRLKKFLYLCLPAKEMHKRIFTYSSPEQLKILAGLLTEHPMEVSVDLVAVVPDVFERAHTDVFKYSNPDLSGYPSRNESLERLRTIADEVHVLPCTSLRYLFQFGMQMVHDRHHHPSDLGLDDELHSRHLIEGWRYRSIHFEKARKQEHIQLVKQVAVHLPSDKYAISSFTARLNPRDWNKRCCRWTTDEGKMTAQDGFVTITDIDHPDVNAEQLEERLLGAGMNRSRE